MTSIEARKQTKTQESPREAQETQYLSFPLGQEHFAVEILRVQEIRPLGTITPIPNVPAHVRGVINLRGTIVPVFDLKRRFALDSGVESRFAIILVVTIKDRIVGIVADSVPKVLMIKANDIAPAPEFGQRVDLSFISGVLQRGEDLVLLLDLDHLLAAELGELAATDTTVSAA